MRFLFFGQAIKIGLLRVFAAFMGGDGGGHAFFTPRRSKGIAAGATSFFVLKLERDAIFIGEPTGGSPNQFGDATVVPLATSGLTGHVATIEWKTAGEFDDRDAREPDVFVPLHADSFFDAVDVTLAAALDHLA